MFIQFTTSATAFALAFALTFALAFASLALHTTPVCPHSRI